MPDPREQSESVAKWMGWKRRDGDAYLPWWKPNGMPVYRLPPYAESLEVMREVEDEIERRGLWADYKAEILNLWRFTPSSGEACDFCLHATSLQRLQAAARVIEEVERAG